MRLKQLVSPKNPSVLVLALTLSLFAVGCKKKVAAPPPPPAPIKEAATIPPPAKPRISSFTAEPSAIERGQASTLRWSISGDATDIRIEPAIGAVNASGSRQVFPGSTTTYTLTGTGPGGTVTETATVNVTAPTPPATVAPPPAKRSLSEILSSDMQDAFFDYDQSSVREDARAVLTKDADVLKGLFNDYPGAVIVVEGHADERGSAEYNLGLADRRATAAKEFLVEQGVSADKLRPVSYGKERPQCTESDEGCWQRNRRAHFSAGQ
ncbi:MAG: OmpA family protein [Bryobacteraceae bacterium]|nr:OmpA family protein [Bryobacteraceae bacterium]